MIVPKIAANYIERGDEEAIILEIAKKAGIYPMDYKFNACPVNQIVEEGDEVRVGKYVLKVIETPGHCIGHVCYVLEANNKVNLFAGDVIFYESGNRKEDEFLDYLTEPRQSELQDLLNIILKRGHAKRNEAYQLIKANGTDLLELLKVSSLLRDQSKGKTVTYSRKVFIPLTNMCRNTCSYCTFVKGPDNPDAHIMNPDEVRAKLKQAEASGCKEVLISLGERPELRYEFTKKWLNKLGYKRMVDYVYDICEMVIKETSMIPHTNAGALKVEEIKKLKMVNGSMGMMLESNNPNLSVHRDCPDKHPMVRLNTIRYAGELKVPFTTGILIGIGESLEDRVDSLFDILELHKKYNHIQEIIIQNFRAKKDTKMANSEEPTIWDMVRTIAVCRLIFGRQMNIQAPPNLTPEMHQLFLLAGINDWGGISPVTPDYINPEKPWPNITALNSVCSELGFTLRERLTVYPEYVYDADFNQEVFTKRIYDFIDERKLVKEEWATC
ncbi:7,8-didemethyl-8-hydroxy-5-deazariboflavin synthase CofG [Alkalihalobacterium alkalinitrilicum]|uniref:7,8-didemethyl-8-hydroxy-5-deazariboflavin synthase CofG n=1 Tax=Alkalihalobacterium alkalinitrilicum TaxID=427920 RepID=UPI000994E5BC|nr:7,8-didemethyl-8-hydroxy-5-deazariboflavin synthase CofG [Alkalihalobacterium alkalinitrilicum]